MIVHPAKRTAFVSGQEQQIFLPDLPTFGCGFVVSATGTKICEGLGVTP